MLYADISYLIDITPEIPKTIIFVGFPVKTIVY